MPTRQFTGNPSQIMVEQLAASGIKYVFNNSGSREAHFFDALHSRDDIHGILALHEGSVAAMAGGYTQGGPRSHGDGGPPGRGTRPVHGPAHQRVAGQPARGGDHLRGRHRQFRRQHHPGPRPQLRSDLHIGAVHQGQLDGHRAGGPAAGHRSRHPRREDAPRRAGAPGRIRPAAEHTTGGHAG